MGAWGTGLWPLVAIVGPQAVANDVPSAQVSKWTVWQHDESWNGRMRIPVTCACGKRLSASPRLAGKRVKCPACQEALVVPAPAATETPRQKNAPGRSGTYSVQSKGGICPHCQAGMDAEDALCVQCGYHRQSGQRLQTLVTEPMMHGRPQDYRVEETEDRLVFQKGPPIKGLPWAIAVLVVGLGVIGCVWLFHPVTAGALLVGFIPVYALALHRETITVDRQQLKVRHFPFPWPRRTIPVSEIEQVYCRKEYRSRGANRDGFYTHEVHVLTSSGGRPNIVRQLPVESHAFFFEERIEHFLGITDREVEEGTWERYGPFVRLAIALIVAIVVLIMTTFL